MPSLSDLTPFQARVLVACDELQARGVYPTIERIRMIVRATQKDIIPARDFLLECGLLVYTTAPGRRGPLRECRPAPVPTAARSRSRGHYHGPLHDTIREYDRAWRRVRKLDGKGRVA